MTMNKVKLIEWNEELGAIENRRRRFEDIIRSFPCAKTGDCIEKYIELYIDSIDYDGMSDALQFDDHKDYATKAIDSIANLAKYESGKKALNEEGYLYMSDDVDEDDIFFRSLTNAYKEGNVVATEIHTIQLAVDRPLCNQLIQLVEKQFKNIVEINTKNASNNRKKIFITYSTSINNLKQYKQTGDYYYSPNDMMETIQAIKTELSNEE